jgi:hypothetical protein
MIRIVRNSDSAPVLQVGQIIFLNGYGQSPSHHQRKAIYKIEDSNWGKMYHWVNLDKPVRGQTEAFTVRHVSQIFGIGTYYKDNDFATDEEITEALQLAMQEEMYEQARKDYARVMKAVAIALGKAYYQKYLPKDTLALIVATFERNTSDSQSDYFGSTTEKIVILAPSAHRRDLFAEMRKAALNTDIAELKALHDAPEDYENREKYTGGNGYYLSAHRYSGWQIFKNAIGETLPDSYYEAAAAGLAYLHVKQATKEQPAQAAPAKTAPATVAPAAPSAKLQLIENYSEKSFAITGETKPVKDKLKELGGKFNPFLTCGAGWIFSKSKLETIKQTFNL